MVEKTHALWGTNIDSPPVYYTAYDAPSLAVSQTKQAMDIAIGAWGNFGPLEVNILGTDVTAALQLEAEYTIRHEALDTNWSHWDSPSVDPSSGFHIFTDYAGSSDAAVSDYRTDYQSYDYLMVTMGTGQDFSIQTTEDYQLVVMHEYWHVYQHSHVMDLRSNDNRVVNPRDEKLGQLYMTEGGANYMALKLYNSTHDMRGDYVLTQMTRYLTDGDALERYKTKGVLLQNITKSDPDSDLYYSIGAWFVAYIESKHTAEHYSVHFYNDLNSLGFEAAFTKTYGKSSTDYLAEFEVFINQPLEDILEIIPSSTSNLTAAGEVNVVVTTLGYLGADIIRGTTANDFLSGNVGNDTIFADGGSDTIAGGIGLDTIKYTLARENYTLADVGNSNQTVVEVINGTTDTINTVERLSFSDVNVDLDIAAKPGEAYRIYKAAFDRAPDLVGLGFWINALDNGHSALEMASGFTNSAEFISLYGANNSNDDYLNLLYNNVLDRDGDPGGHAFWLGHLDAGSVTREQLLIDFSESRENKANVIDLIANGIDYVPYGIDLMLV